MTYGKNLSHSVKINHTSKLQIRISWSQLHGHKTLHGYSILPKDSLTTTTKKKLLVVCRGKHHHLQKMHHVIMSLMVNYYSLVTFLKAREFRVVSEGHV